MNEDKEFVTLTVNSNLLEPLYMNREFTLSYDEKEAIAFEARFVDVIAKDRVFEFIKNNNAFSEKIASNTAELKIDLVYEKADLTKFPIRTNKQGKIIYCQQPTLKMLIAEQKEKIREIEEEIQDLENQIDQLESEKDTLEDIDLEEAKSKLAELELEGGGGE